MQAVNQGSVMTGLKEVYLSAEGKDALKVLSSMVIGQMLDESIQNLVNGSYERRRNGQNFSKEHALERIRLQFDTLRELFQKDTEALSKVDQV